MKDLLCAAKLWDSKKYKRRYLLMLKLINSLNHNLELGLSEEHAFGVKKVGKGMLSVSCKKDLY